jgi:hypothetical protein
MYASCGWFFDDIAGLEASLVIRMGAHALDLLREAGGTPPTAAVLDALAQGRSNHREAGTGADVFRRVSRHRVTPAHAVGRAALERLVAPGAPARTPGFDVAFLEEVAGEDALGGLARARRRRTGVTTELDFTASARPGGVLEATVAGQRLSLGDLGDEARGALIMADLPALISELANPEVTRLVVEAARELPPDNETPEGLARREALTRALFALLASDRGGPTADAVRAAADILEVMRLPAGATERRRLEERVWALCERGRPSAALRALADKLGFASRAEAAETAAS